MVDDESEALRCVARQWVKLSGKSEILNDGGML